MHVSEIYTVFMECMPIRCLTGSMQAWRGAEERLRVAVGYGR